MQGNVLEIISSLDCDVHEATDAVIEGIPMLVFNLFQFFQNKRCSYEELLLKICYQWKR